MSTIFSGLVGFFCKKYIRDGCRYKHNVETTCMNYAMLFIIIISIYYIIHLKPKYSIFYLLETIILIHNKSTKPNNFWKTTSFILYVLQNTLRLKIWRNEICLISEGKLVFILCMIEKKKCPSVSGWPVWFQLNQLNLQYFTIIYNNFPYECNSIL